MRRIGHEMRRCTERREHHGQEQRRLQHADHRTGGEVRERCHERQPPEVPGDEWRRDGGRDGRGNHFAGHVAPPPTPLPGEQPPDQGAARDQAAHPTHAELPAQVEYLCGVERQRNQRADGQRGPRTCRPLQPLTERAKRKHHRGADGRGGSANDRDVCHRDGQRQPELQAARSPERAEQQLQGRGDDRHVQARDRQHVDDSRRGKSVAHVRRHGAHIGDQQGAHEGCIATEERVDRTTRAPAEHGQQVAELGIAQHGALDHHAAIRRHRVTGRVHGGAGRRVAVGNGHRHRHGASGGARRPTDQRSRPGRVGAEGHLPGAEQFEARAARGVAAHDGVSDQRRCGNDQRERRDRQPASGARCRPRACRRHANAVRDDGRRRRSASPDADAAKAGEQAGHDRDRGPQHKRHASSRTRCAPLRACGAGRAATTPGSLATCGGAMPRPVASRRASRR